ncbi:hypothetical protein [Miltoncostaea oceani]|uniref:hypothetical protein n=1 Tax=Miltoncostaea oceani TaxID=2843216 RepID=UPI001C3DC78E|nr:hypothetical protein [Miltoncostaea oceani]
MRRALPSLFIGAALAFTVWRLVIRRGAAAAEPQTVSEDRTWGSDGEPTLEDARASIARLRAAARAAQEQQG